MTKKKKKPFVLDKDFPSGEKDPLPYKRPKFLQEYYDEQEKKNRRVNK